MGGRESRAPQLNNELDFYRCMLHERAAYGANAARSADHQGTACARSRFSRPSSRFDCVILFAELSSGDDAPIQPAVKIHTANSPQRPVVHAICRRTLVFDSDDASTSEAEEGSGGKKQRKVDDMLMCGHGRILFSVYEEAACVLVLGRHRCTTHNVLVNGPKWSTYGPYMGSLYGP